MLTYNTFYCEKSSYRIQKRAFRRRPFHAVLVAAAVSVAVAVTVVIVVAAEDDEQDYKNPNPGFAARTTVVTEEHIINTPFRLIVHNTFRHQLLCIKKQRFVLSNLCSVILVYSSRSDICTVAAHMVKRCVANGMTGAWRMDNLPVTGIDTDMGNASAL